MKEETDENKRRVSGGAGIKAKYLPNMRLQPYRCGYSRSRAAHKRGQAWQLSQAILGGI
jgi:hypothetical protein